MDAEFGFDFNGSEGNSDVNGGSPSENSGNQELVHIDGRGIESDDELDFEIAESDKGTKFFIPIVRDDMKPKVDAQFKSLKDAVKWYRNYARKAGFDVRLNAKKTNRFGQISTRWLVCSKEGYPKKRDFDSLGSGPGARRYRNSNVKRSGCNACCKIHLTKDRSHYEIYEFVEAHNHVLFNSNDRRFSRSNRQMQYTDYKLVLNSSSYKVGPTRTHRIQTAVKGGFEHARCTAVDFQNFKRDMAGVVGNKDAKMLLNKLSNRRDIVSEYFFEYKVTDHQLTAIFWADEVSRINYKEFGDVISFDGTFRTNMHAMVFVPFLAVDNHKSSVLVGSALISREIVDNYAWVLSAFLRCHEKQPSVVITDQCPSMKQAIPMVFTESKHRLCMWHIMNKVPGKVSAALKKDPEFNRVINKLVWNVHIGPAEFEASWQQMIEKYGLVGDPWFTEMYAIRQSWIPAYYKDAHMSGLMKTTSRSESSNSYINIYESFYFDLVQFLINYDFAIEKQRYKQSVYETVTRTTFPQLCTPLLIERHASNTYTRSIFFDIQKEIKKAVYFCRLDIHECLGDVKTFVISHKTKESVAKVKYMVVRNYTDNTVDCECNFFVRHGILCRHALKVLINEEVDCIPDRYIVRRWTRQLVPVQVQSARVRYGEVDVEKEKLLVDLYAKVDDIVSRVRNDKTMLHKLCQILDTFLQTAEKELPYEEPSQQKIDAIQEHLGVDVPDEVDIFPPTGIRNKGCGTGKRLVSGKERIQSKSKKTKRKCAKCGLRTGHDSRNCPNV